MKNIHPKSSYKPIACSFHDLILHHATLQDELELSYYENEKTAVENCRIMDVITKESEEFLITSSAKRIRLDQIISINGEMLSLYC